MEKTIEQRAAIRFCWKTGFNVTKTFEMIQKVYGEFAVHRATLLHWYDSFSEGRESIRDEQRSGRPTTKKTHKNIARVAHILKEDRRSLCRLIAEWTGTPKTIVQQILCKDLQKWKLCMWFVPHALTVEQKEQRLNHTYDFIKTIKSNSKFLDSIITGDESCVLHRKLSAKVLNGAVRTHHPPKNFDFKNQG